mmetsp:Transcript_19369/g.37691  ORF Transcript_19369/g.37691 Transcript_19369/m.37691 type:complete len:281 (-) Transcript_19369:45-887(-)
MTSLMPGRSESPEHRRKRLSLGSFGSEFDFGDKLSGWNRGGIDETSLAALCAGLVAAREIDDSIERARMRFREAVHIVIHIERLRKGDDRITATDKLYEAIRAIIAKKRAEKRSLVRRLGLEEAQEAMVAAVRDAMSAMGGPPLTDTELNQLKREFDEADKEGKGYITQHELEKLAFRRTYHSRKMDHRKAHQSSKWVENKKEKRQPYSMPPAQIKIDRNTAKTTASVGFKELSGSHRMDFERFCGWHKRFARGAMGNISEKGKMERSRRQSAAEVTPQP